MTRAAESGKVDGRTARAERTRSAIVDAHLALLSEGDLRPTGERIAERAGVSLRALWINFKDMETLFAATNERLMAQQDARFRPVPTDLPLDRRVDEFCRQRARMLEFIAPAARASLAREPFSAQLRRNRARHITRVRNEIEELFAAELAGAEPDREELVNALTVVTMWPAWAMLRDSLGLSVGQARGVMVRSVSELLAGATVRSRGPG